MTATRNVETPAALTYDVGASGSAGIWLGLGTTRVTVLALGLLASVVTLTAGYPVLVAVLPLLLAAVVTGVRVEGRPLLDWVVPFGAHHGAIMAGTARWRSRIPAVPTGRVTDAEVRLRVPIEFGRPRLAACPDDPAIGMVTDTSGGTVTVVFDVCGVDRFPLLDSDEQDVLIAGWGDALGVLADTEEALVRLQLIERASPTREVVADPCPPEAQRGENSGLVREISALATGHASRLAVQWFFPRLDATVVATIAERCHLVSRSLLSARLLTRPLSVTEVTEDIATGLTGESPSAGSVRAGVGPVSRRSDWTQVSVDDRVHRSFAVAGWPTTAVGAAWLAPLLLVAPAGVTRTVSLHLERVTPAAAARVARTRRAKAVLDQSDRARLGMTSSAALQVAEASGVAMDAELAAGYRTHRLAGLVTLSADSVDALDDAGRVLRQAAATCRVELRPLHGQHDVALAATVPLCRLRPRGHA
jgi:hypothetical protein